MIVARLSGYSVNTCFNSCCFYNCSWLQYSENNFGLDLLDAMFDYVLYWRWNMLGDLFLCRGMICGCDMLRGVLGRIAICSCGLVCGEVESICRG